MEFRNNCCRIAIPAAILAILLVSVLRGYDILDWTLMSWLGAAIVVAAFWLCMVCRKSDEEEEDKTS